MDASSVGQTADVLGQILQMAEQKTTEQASNLMKVAVQMGLEVGKGEVFDAVA